MLLCADNSFYVGHTDDLQTRLASHSAGEIKGYTQSRRPVVLVFSQEFPTRSEALEGERRIKGWSLAKKAALVRGDFAGVSGIAKKGSPESR